MKFSIPGLLGAIGELPSVINKGLLGPLTTNPNLGLDPTQVDQARQVALQDMAYGMMAAPRSNPMAGMAFARGNARENFSGRMVDLLREQEIERMKQQRSAGDAYIQTLPEGLRGAAQVAGAQPVAQAQISAALSPQEQPWRMLSPEEEASIPGLDPTLMYKTNGQDIEVLGGRPPVPTIGSISVGGGAAGLPDYIKERQKAVATQLGTYEEQGAKSQSTIAQLDSLSTKAKDAKMSGALAPGLIGLGNFARSIGLDVAPEDLTAARNFQAANNQSILKWMAATGGARGYTEKESQILVDSFGKIQDSPDARLTIIKTMREAAVRDYEAARKGIKLKKTQLEEIGQGGLGVTELPDVAPAPVDVSQYPQAVNPKTKEVLIFKDGKWQKP